MYIVDGKQIDLVDYDWKYLAILDASRYDYFMDVYRKVFPDAVPKKAITTTLSTPQFMKNFENKDCHDIVYLNTVVKFDAWLPKQNMFKVVHVWDLDWSNNIGNIHPKSVNERFFSQYRSRPDKRFVLHYMQPHPPHISIGGNPADRKENHVGNFSMDFKTKYFSQYTVWSFKKILHIKPTLPLEICYRNHGKQGVIQAYKDDIILGLEYVKMAMKKSPGKWVITADHGMTVTEKDYGLCGNDLGYKKLPNIKELVETVPWMEVTV